MSLDRTRTHLLFASVSHALVDLICFFMLFRWKAQGGDAIMLAGGFLLYNVLAFGLELPLGYWLDGRTHGARTGRVLLRSVAPGLGLGVVAYFLHPILGVIGLGLANALFHGVAGRSVLLRSAGRMTPNGIFISTGALGVALGTWIGLSAIPVTAILIPLFALSLLTELVSRYDLALASADPRGSAGPLPRITRARLPFALIIAGALVAVVIRAYAGSNIAMSWRTAGLLLLLPGIAAFLGKAFGGVAADRWGARMIAVASLAASAVMLGLFSETVPLAVIGLALFNMCTAITLCALYERLPRHPGVAFGATTAALLVGTIPTYFIAVSNPRPIMVLLTLVSAAILGVILVDRPSERT